ncbi:MAG: hypothetical protein ACTSVI_12430 [Promethearchaeota archaeon]
MADVVVVLSYFDSKVGPTCFIEIPVNKIGTDIEIVLNQIFDQTTTEGFFWHSISGIYQTSLNYYFEINSDWARGNKEMLMISIVFKEKIETEKEHDVLSWVIDFVQKMRTKDGVFKAFYYSPQNQIYNDEHQDLYESYMIVEKWAKELYWSIKEEIRKKAEEEIIANLMVNNALLKTIKKLSKFPIKYNELKNWFKKQDFVRDFDSIISLLEKHKFIFINNIRHETYVLLVKDVNIFRVPPACLVELMEKDKEHQTSLIKYYIKIVTEYFNNYQPKTEDIQNLYSFLSRPKHYNLINVLRKGPVLKSKINKILRQGPMIASRLDVLGELKDADIIDEFESGDSVYILLKNDIIIQDQFPEYIQKAIPEEQKKENKPMSQEYQLMKEELKGLFSFSNDEFEVLQQDLVNSDIDIKGVLENEENIDDVENDLLIDDNSPFDMIIDEISHKFIEEEEKGLKRKNRDFNGKK